MTTATTVGDRTVAYLERCGYTAQKINLWTSETRILHDLGLCGDDVSDEFAILNREFGVDLSGLEMAKYFPSEHSVDAFIISLRRPLRAVGLGQLVNRVLGKYSPLTLGMIEAALLHQRWNPDDESVGAPPVS